MTPAETIKTKLIDDFNRPAAQRKYNGVIQGSLVLYLPYLLQEFRLLLKRKDLEEFIKDSLQRL